jgi:hypothetical protein
VGAKQVFFALTLVLLLWGGAGDSRGQDATCEEENAKWVAMYTALNEALDSYRVVKEESVAPIIEQKRDEFGKGAALARIVQASLAERSNRLADAEAKCLSLADSERSAFEEWRSCASGGRARRAPSAKGVVATASRDRETLLAKMRDLLLDEAYAQYKNQRDPAPSGYSQYGPWGPGRQRIGYQ